MTLLGWSKKVPKDWRVVPLRAVSDYVVGQEGRLLFSGLNVCANERWSILCVLKHSCWAKNRPYETGHAVRQ